MAATSNYISPADKMNLLWRSGFAGFLLTLDARLKPSPFHASKRYAPSKLPFLVKIIYSSALPNVLAARVWSTNCKERVLLTEFAVERFLPEVASAKVPAIQCRSTCDDRQGPDGQSCINKRRPIVANFSKKEDLSSMRHWQAKKCRQWGQQTLCQWRTHPRLQQEKI